MTTVIWIDWYAYHHARLRALTEHPRLRDRVTGIELVGKEGVHKGLVFREKPATSMPLITLLPGASWSLSTQVKLGVKLWQKLNVLKPTTLLVPGYYTIPAFAAALWGNLNRSQTVLMTESTQHDHQRTGWKEWVKGKMISLLFDSAISGGKSHRRYLEALGYPSSQVAGCYDVVDNDYFANEAKNWRLRGDRPIAQEYFLYVGRFAPEKNLGTLVEAYRRYRENGGKWDLMLVGGGPEEVNLRAKAKGLTGVHFAGLKNSRELPQYYAFSSCFVLPSSREPWGLVANEAMASGLPVILSNRCGCIDDLLVGEENGYAFSPTDVGDLAAKLAAMSSLMPSQRSEMSRRATEIIASYAPSKWADEVASLTDRMTSGGNVVAHEQLQ